MSNTVPKVLDEIDRESADYTLRAVQGLLAAGYSEERDGITTIVLRWRGMRLDGVKINDERDKVFRRGQKAKSG